MLHPHRGQLLALSSSSPRRGETRWEKRRGKENIYRKIRQKNKQLFLPRPHPPAAIPPSKSSSSIRALNLHWCHVLTSATVGVLQHTPKYGTATVQGSLPDPKGTPNINAELESCELKVPDAQARLRNTSSTCSNGPPHSC